METDDQVSSPMQSTATGRHGPCHPGTQGRNALADRGKPPVRRWGRKSWLGLILFVLLAAGTGWGLQRRPLLLPPDEGEDPAAILASAETDPDQFEFVWTRLMYDSPGYQFARNNNSWTTDYPKADKQFLQGMLRYTKLHASRKELVLRPDDPELLKHPFVYAVEVGYLKLSDQEAAHLREYLLRGGFLVVDDFHGTREWANFEQQMKKVFPDRPIRDVPLSDPIFHCLFDIQELFQVPGLQFLYTGRIFEKDGYNARYAGIYDDKGRIMVMINFNQDLGDAWEWADLAAYPLRYTSQAYQLGSNYIIYSLTH